MIVELVLGAGLLAAASLAYRNVHERRARARRSPEGPERRGLNPRLDGPRGLRVDDVLLYADTELWLAGCFELDEEGLVARVFRTPGNRAAEWVLQLDAEGRDVALARETDEVPGGAVPAELSLRQMRYSMTRRASVAVHRSGAELPPATARATAVFFAGPGGRVALVLDFKGGARLALEGERVAPELLELLPAGDGEG